MNVRISLDGTLVIIAETTTEEYALTTWKNKNRILMEDVKRNESYYYRGTSILLEGDRTQW